MLISRSFLHKITATLGAAVGFVFVYEATVRYSRETAPMAMAAEAAMRASMGTSLEFSATAYCKGETTASGVNVRTGVAAADPTLLPVGSVVRVDTPDSKYDGIWTIMDTGPAVQGRTIDLYMWNCNEALKFGRRPVRVNVMRLGWNPANSEPAIVDPMFERREKQRLDPALPASTVVPATLPPTPTPPL